MKAIGAKGFESTVNRYWAGDKAAYLEHQRQRANQAVLEDLTDIKLRAELAAGKEIASAELPVIVDPDDDGTFWQDMVQRKGRGQASWAG